MIVVGYSVVDVVVVFLSLIVVLSLTSHVGEMVLSKNVETQTILVCYCCGGVAIGAMLSLM